MKKKISVFPVICSMLFGMMPVYAETTTSLPESETSSEESKSVQLIDLLIKPYLEEIETYNQENGETFTVNETDKWLFWYANYKTEYEQFDSVLESMAEELETEEESAAESESESESLSQTMYLVPTEMEDDMMQNTLQELLIPYEHGIEVVNDAKKSEFEIPTELEWNFFYQFADMTESDFVAYLESEYDQIESEEKENTSEKTKTFLEETVKNAQTERDEVISKYQTVIDQLQEEQGITITVSDDEKWLAAITLDYFSVDELYDYLTKQLEQ